MPTIKPVTFSIENAEITVYIENNFVYRKHDTLFAAPHIHTLHEIYIVLEGELIVNPKKDEEMLLTSNEGCIFPPLRYHNSVSAAFTNTKRLGLKFSFKKIKVDKTELDLYGILNCILNNSQKIVKFNINRNTINDIISHSDNLDDPFNIIILKTVFSLIFTKIAEQNQMDFSKSENSTEHQVPQNIDAVIRLIHLDGYLEKYTTGQMSFPEIATKLYISTKQLSRIIFENYRETPKSLLFEYKMRRAEFFLSETGFSVKNIAEILGYSSPNAFTILFKKYAGISPTQYKKNVKLIKKTSEEQQSSVN